MFVDEARVLVASGRGGDGAVTFHREKYQPKGGPDGGDGGRGGSVVLIADRSVGSLQELRDHPHRRAKPGGKGGSNRRSGAAAGDLEIRVPVGTVVKDDEGVLLADLASTGDRFVPAKGGRGGRGNAAFLTGARRAPRFAELGEPGEERWIQLELRLIADVAVIGYPNAGKSTLVAAVSAARPKIAPYPFTTLEPSLGVVERGEERFVICDIPGLVEGAHEGKGLGLKFLRHVERAPVLVHLIDLASGRDPLADYETVRRELGEFRKDLLERPEVVALNKTDITPGEVVRQVRLHLAEASLDALPISAATGNGLDELLGRLEALVVRVRKEHLQPEGFELFRTPPGERVNVEREDGAWRVTGREVERWVAMTDLSNPEAVGHLQTRLERAGVERALADAGARHGDEVRIGGAVFEWWPAGVEPPAPPPRAKRGRRP